MFKQLSDASRKASTRLAKAAAALESPALGKMAMRLSQLSQALS